MFYFMNIVRSFVNYAIFRELCDWMRFEVDCAKSHHRIILYNVCHGFCLLDKLQTTHFVFIICIITSVSEKNQLLLLYC